MNDVAWVHIDNDASGGTKWIIKDGPHTNMEWNELRILARFDTIPEVFEFLVNKKPDKVMVWMASSEEWVEVVDPVDELSLSNG